MLRSAGGTCSGDLARRDADGWFWFVGRADDVIKSAGHLIGPFEVESVLMEHPAVAEAGVIGIPDPLLGERIKAFVALKPGISREPADLDVLRREISAHARRRLGPAVAPREIAFDDNLPKTRSGKIMRRLLRARELGLAEGDLSTLEVPRRAGRSIPMTADASRDMRLLRDMLLVRRFEERCVELYSAGSIRGFLHVYIGEEAVATGVMSALEPDDAIVATYREHGHALLKGMSARSVMAEMFGKVTGCCRGRGGSMHLFDAPTRFYGGNAIVGGGLPLAVGLALADKLAGRDRVTACFFGEGAMAEGEFHESINLAAIWGLPVLFVCENNLYAMGTALARSESETNLAVKASAYEVPAWSVDGMDVRAVAETARRAVDSVRAGGGPHFLEARTFRFRAHSMFDPERYREKSEVEAWKAHDPIQSLRDRMTAEGALTDADVEAMEAEIAAIVEDAADVRGGLAAGGCRRPAPVRAHPGQLGPATGRRAGGGGAMTARKQAARRRRVQETPAATTLTYREAVREAIREAMLADDRVFLMGEDVGMYGGCFGVSMGLLEQFGPERIRDTPLSESAFVGAGIGAALGGMRPIVEIMTVNFSLLALDQIMNTAAALQHMSGGQFQVPAGHPDDDRRGPAAGRAALAQPRGLVRPHPRHPDRGTGDDPRRARACSPPRSRTPIRC